MLEYNATYIRSHLQLGGHPRPAETSQQLWGTVSHSSPMDLNLSVLKSIDLENSDIRIVAVNHTVRTMPGVREFALFAPLLLGKTHQSPVPYLAGSQQHDSAYYRCTCTWCGLSE